MISIVLGNIMMGISILLNVITMQQKEKKRILIGLILVNIASIICYILLKSYSAVLVCVVAVIQTFIKYKFDQKDKKIPIYIQFIFIVVSIVGGLFTSQNLLDVIPIICLVLYTLSILQSKEKNIRLFTVANILGWMIYDFYAKAYVGILFSLFTLTSTIIAIIRYDIKKRV